DYRDREQLRAFAARRRRQFQGKALAVDRLIGFCLLIRREVLERIGGFDERYGLGFLDDDDLSLRARQAGFRLLVALNAFVHHFGGRTFLGLGIDRGRQMERNRAIFDEKWQNAAAPALALPTPRRGPQNSSVNGVAGQRGLEELHRLALADQQRGQA